MQRVLRDWLESDHMIFTPDEVYTFNRCPILAYKKISAVSPAVRLLRAHMIRIASAYALDPLSPMTVNQIADKWDADWGKAKSVLEKVSKQENAKRAGAGLTKLLMFNVNISKSGPPRKPMYVDVTKFLVLDEQVGLNVSLDMVTMEGTLVTFGLMGSHNRYMTRHNLILSAPFAWASLVWTGKHILRDMSRKNRFCDLVSKPIAGYKEQLHQYLRGMYNVLSGDVIPGIPQPICTLCNKCDGLYYVERGDESCKKKIKSPGAEL